MFLAAGSQLIPWIIFPPSQNLELAPDPSAGLLHPVSGPHATYPGLGIQAVGQEAGSRIQLDPEERTSHHRPCPAGRRFPSASPLGGSRDSLNSAGPAVVQTSARGPPRPAGLRVPSAEPEQQGCGGHRVAPWLWHQAGLGSNTGATPLPRPRHPLPRAQVPGSKTEDNNRSCAGLLQRA